MQKDENILSLSDASPPELSPLARPRLAQHRLVLMGAWAVTTATLVAMLGSGVRSTDGFNTIRYALHACYVAALLWHLARAEPSIGRLSDTQAQVPPRRRYAAWIPAVALALLVALMAVSDDGMDIVMLLLIAATAWILIAWRRKIRLAPVLQGLVLALLALLAGIPIAQHGLISRTGIFLLAGFAAPMYVAGGLLVGRTRLGGVQIREGRFGEALRSVLTGFLLFVPLGLANAADGSPGRGLTWVTEWWMPFSLPWFSGIVEETWFRLFLIGLCFFLLQPAMRKRPSLAALAAVLFSGIVFGLGHGRTFERFLTTGLLYGVPMAAVFAKRDWEHAVGAHYMINVIPWVMVFLEA